MNLNQVTLPSTDVARAVTFYRGLGFRQIVAALPDYARFECPVGGATFSLHRVDAPVARSGVVVYFECADVDRTVARLRREGVTFLAEPRDQPWLWREAYLRDPDGNTLCLFHAGPNRRRPPWRVRDEAAPAAAPYVISVEDAPRDDDVQVLRDGLTAHALPTTQVPGFAPVAVFARDPTGAIVGGIFAIVNWNWLHVALVWVAEPLRGSGLGRQLLERIEAVGRERGCTHAHLDTFSYQARPFYERHGYELFATLDEYPPGQQRFFMRKTLAHGDAA